MDALFADPYVDVDEWREAPQPHRFVHGGFHGTETRFSFYFPPAEGYEGRFITVIEGGQAGHESRAEKLQGDVLPAMGWAFAAGAYLVESNGGHIAPGPVALTRAPHDATVTGYRATAAATRYARELAAEHYGEPPRYGYIAGGSGGGRALLGLENTRGIWDGCIQWINAAGHGVSLPAVLINAVRVLGSKISQVAAAFEPGGNHDPFQGLDSAAADALATLYRSGFQPGGEFQLESPGPELGVLQITKKLSEDYDPGYFEDFWSLPGYLGADGGLDDALVDEVVSVERLVTIDDLPPDVLDRLGGRALRSFETSTPIGLVVHGASRRYLGADVIVSTGAASGRKLLCVHVAGDSAIVDVARGEGLQGVRAGDEIRFDNRRFLAYVHSYCHQVDLDAPESRQFAVGGNAIYPQRVLALQDVLVGVRMTGDFEGKVIYVGSVNDSMSTPTAWPVTYAGQVRRKLGARAPDHLRVWLNDHATHIQGSDRPPGPPPVAFTRLIDWAGSVEQAVEDMIGWVERGEAPPPDTRFDYEDGRMTLAPSATQRGGIQPVVTATANGGESTTVAAGEPVLLEAIAEAPPGAGTIIQIEWDFDGRGTWPFVDPQVDGQSARVSSELEHVFAVPGVYFPAVRVTAHRHGLVAARHCRVLNLARVRVEVL